MVASKLIIRLVNKQKQLRAIHIFIFNNQNLVERAYVLN